MNDFDEKMEVYRKIGTRLCLLPDAVTRIGNMEDKMKRTRIGKKILVFNLSVLLASLLTIPLTVYGAYQVLYEKVGNADYSQEQIKELDAQLKHQEFSDDDITVLNDLNLNEYGQTYGPDALGADLIEVISDQGEVGYVYREDLEATEANTLKETLENEEVYIIKVYENDGKTAIGTFTLTDGSGVH